MGWIWGAGPAPATIAVVVYTRQGCHLCDNAWAHLQTASRRYPLALTTIDVDGDLDLQTRYGELVPVVEIAGKVRFRGCIRPVLLNRLLDKLVEKSAQR